MKLTKLFHKGADCGMRLGIGGQDLVIFREFCLKFFLSWSKKGQQNKKWSIVSSFVRQKRQRGDEVFLILYRNAFKLQWPEIIWVIWRGGVSLRTFKDESDGKKIRIVELVVAESHSNSQILESHLSIFSNLEAEKGLECYLFIVMTVVCK